MRSRPVPDAELLAAARVAHDLSDLLARLGLEETPSRRRHLRARLLRLGEDTSHWPPLRQRYRRDVLLEAVAGSSSFAGVLRALQVKQAGGSQAHLARRIRQEGLDTRHLTGQASQRGVKRPAARPEDVLVVRPPGSQRVRAHRLRQALLDVGVPHRCAACDLPPVWRGEQLTLVVDHVDGDWLDNRRANLRFLCPNCHAQTATWCRKKGP